MELSNAHKRSLKNTELYKCQVAVIITCPMTPLSLFQHVFSLAGEPEKCLRRGEFVVIISSKILLYKPPLPRLTRLSQEDAQIFVLIFLCYLPIILDITFIFTYLFLHLLTRKHLF